MFKDWQKILHQHFAGGLVIDYVWCAAILIGTLLLRKPLSKLIMLLFLSISDRRKKAAAHRAHDRRLLQRPLQALLTITGIFYAFTTVNKPLGKIRLFKIQSGKTLRYLKLSVLLEHIIALFAIIFLSWLVSKLVDFFYRKRTETVISEGRRNRMQMYSLLRDVIKILVWIFCFFWLLGAVFEVNVPALITGLGIGGVAIALAAKESLENLIASFTILADKPLAVGDVIRLDKLEGTVERVGFRSTRLRHADGSLIVVPNKKIVDGYLENLTQRAGKAYTITLFLKADVRIDRLQKLRESVVHLLEETKEIQQPITVRLDTFNETSWQLTATYNLPFPAPPGIVAEEFREKLKMRIYTLMHDAANPDIAAGNPSA